MSETFHGLSRIDPDAKSLLPELISHARQIKQMDEAHADLYLWGSTSNWISPWQASELRVIMQAAKLAKITKEDIIIDLGCGDGRVNLALAKNLGCKGYGWDASKVCIDTANAMKEASEIGEHVIFRQLDFTTKDIVEKDLEESTVYFAYLPVAGLQRIRTLIVEWLKKNSNSRLITNEYHYPDTDNWIILAEEGPIRVSRPKRDQIC